MVRQRKESGIPRCTQIGRQHASNPNHSGGIDYWGRTATWFKRGSNPGQLEEQFSFMLLMTAMHPDSARSLGGIADAIQPNLPPELERHIFELAALSHPMLIPNMIRVAWRVKLWIEPLLYRTLAFGVKIDGLPIFRPEIVTQIAHTKAHLLESARNVMALAPRNDGRNRSDMSPHRKPRSDVSPLPLVGLFAAIRSQNELAVCLHLLTICERLSALILLDPSHWHYEGYAELDLLCTDPRFVMLSRKNWTTDWLQIVDYRARADLFIAKRMSGEIERGFSWAITYSPSNFESRIMPGRAFFLEDTS
ncbi:hypothetical protein DFH06DRAFT_1130657 [Mycena polygramma]|nr:hypothetical protein DFH06DRAFT_1130657 [Mycena polygramma]